MELSSAAEEHWSDGALDVRVCPFNEFRFTLLTSIVCIPKYTGCGLYNHWDFKEWL